MTHIFYEFTSLKPGVPDVETLMQVINSSAITSFVIGPEVVDFVKKALIVNTTIVSFKNCKFASITARTSLNSMGKGNRSVTMRFRSGLSPLLTFPAPSGSLTISCRM